MASPDSQRAAVISYGFWQRRFGGDPRALGATMQIGPGSYQLVGVLPAGFIGVDAGHPGETANGRDQIWLPMAQMWAGRGLTPARACT